MSLGLSELLQGVVVVTSADDVDDIRSWSVGNALSSNFTTMRPSYKRAVLRPRTVAFRAKRTSTNIGLGRFSRERPEGEVGNQTSGQLREVAVSCGNGVTVSQTCTC